MIKPTKALLLKNQIGITVLDHFISEINGIKHIWKYCKTDNLGRLTKCQKDAADCIFDKSQDYVEPYFCYIIKI